MGVTVALGVTVTLSLSSTLHLPISFLYLVCCNSEDEGTRGTHHVLSARSLIDELKAISPFVDANSSHCGALDGGLETPIRSGRSLPEAMMRMIPEAWQNDPTWMRTRKHLMNTFQLS